jgi:peptide/nickel transport system substrate-binding protein
MLNWFVALNIISPQANAELGEKLGVTAVGTGPYKFAEYIPNDRFVLEANPEYWGEKPKLKRIVFRVIPEDSSRLAALEAGEIDMMTEVSPDHVKRIESHPNLKLISTDTVRVLYIRLRENRKPLDDVRVRRALNYAVNKKEIVRYLLRGMGAVPTAPLHPLLMGYNPNLTSYAYNPEKAKELLAEAGYPNGFTLTYSSTHGRYIKDKQIAEAIVGQLKKIGITCEYTPLEIGTMVSQDLFGDTHDMYSLAFGGILWDPDLPLSFFHNVLKYDNPEYVRLIEIGRTNQDKKVYEKAYQDALAVMWYDAPMIWVSYHPQIIGIQKNVKGFKPKADELVIVNNVWKTE